MLLGLAGFGLILFSPTPNLTPLPLGFLALAAGLLISGVTDLTVRGSHALRIRLRTGSLALQTVGLLTVFLGPVLFGR